MIQITPSAPTVFKAHLTQAPTSSVSAILSIRGEADGAELNPPVSINFEERWSSIAIIPFDAPDGFYELTITDGGEVLFIGSAYISDDLENPFTLDDEHEYTNNDIDYTYE